MGCLVEWGFNLLFFIPFCSSLPFVVVSLDPLNLCLALLSPPAKKRFPSVSTNVVIVTSIVVLGRAVYCGNCFFCSVVFNGDVSSLYIFMSIFCSYVVFNVLSNYYCSTSVRCFVWVISVIYIVVWCCYVASVGETGF